MLHSCSVFAVIAASAIAAADVIETSGSHVEINEYGVIVAHDAGALHTVDGPSIDLSNASPEWWGLSFTQGGDRSDYCGRGTASDWSTGRTLADATRSKFNTHAALIVDQAGAVQITTWARFDGDDLVLTVTFLNTSDQPVIDIIYAREWAVAGEGFDFPPDMEAPMPDHRPGIARRLWMPDNLLPGTTRSITFSYRPVHAVRGSADPVPLTLWTGGSWPFGLDVGPTNGVSWGDYNHDGWPDIYSQASGRLWQNDNGQNWFLASDLLPIRIASSVYGSAFGDYDNDSLPDLVTAPRGCCSDLFHNLGGGSWENLMFDPDIVLGDHPNGAAETICWADVDGDANLDCFIPVYPAWAGGGPGNFFLYNLGPTAPGGAYRFQEMVVAAGLDNVPPNSARPEGAQFADTDDDGDVEMYTGGYLYQNHSIPGNPSFQFMTPAASGIGFSTSLDEGAVLFDYDMDGDLDLFVVYTGPCNKLWESRGDGTFFEHTSVIESPCSGLDLGMSAEDWDNDGDIDYTTRSIFRQNMLMETGTAQFIVASHPTIPSDHLISATPAWADFDKDGDLDCMIGDWQDFGNFYENTTYSVITPLSQRRYVRVRVVRDSDSFPQGLETEYGAVVEVAVHGEDGLRRKKSLSSSNGYLNQNEYVLSFALPDDPTSGNPATDIVFDISVDFPTVGSGTRRRIDKFVNAALGDLTLAQLGADREITVWRSGQAEVAGITTAPTNPIGADLYEAGGGLARPDPGSGLLGLFSAGSHAWAGIEFNTLDAFAPIAVKELIIDGDLGPATDCDPDTFSIALYDVTDTEATRIRTWSPIINAANRRHHIPVDLVLQPGHRFRLIATLTTFRPTTFAGPVTGPLGLTVDGGVFFNVTASGQNICPDDDAASAGPIPDSLYISFTYAAEAETCIPDFVPPFGTLDFFDVQEFLERFSAHDPTADLTHDSEFNFFDVQLFLQLFSEGCP